MSQDKKLVRRYTGRVAFLSRLKIFRERLNAGHTQISIYDEFMSDLNISYSNFSKYVRRYIKDDKQHEERRIAGRDQAASTRERAIQEAPKEQPVSGSLHRPVFRHNPASKDRKDLI